MRTSRALTLSLSPCPRLKNLISEAVARLGLMLVLHLPSQDLRAEESYWKEMTELCIRNDGSVESCATAVHMSPCPELDPLTLQCRLNRKALVQGAKSLLLLSSSMETCPLGRTTTSQQPYQSNPRPLSTTSSSNLSKTLPTPFRATLNCESALTRE